jgi:aspartate/methionine/tyrosine aminotransferase
MLVVIIGTSKGFFGECGKRGGYVELSGIDPEVEKQLLKLASIGLCSSVAGQITTDLMVILLWKDQHNSASTTIWLSRSTLLLPEKSRMSFLSRKNKALL